MAKILVTGASGLIGRAMVADVSNTHDVVALSRASPGQGDTWIKGSFAHFEDLRQLDDHAIEAVIHLGAVTGGGPERDGILVNVEGTRCLMRYLADRGCRKFVMASSIAAVGFQSTMFRPCQVPIPDEHPCLDRDGYGFSKYLMEEVSKYHHRQNPEIDVINLRLSSVCPDENMPPLQGPADPHLPAGVRYSALQRNRRDRSTRQRQSRPPPSLRHLPPSGCVSLHGLARAPQFLCTAPPESLR